MPQPNDTAIRNLIDLHLADHVAATMSDPNGAAHRKAVVLLEGYRRLRAEVAALKEDLAAAVAAAPLADPAEVRPVTDTSLSSSPDYLASEEDAW